MKKVLVIVCALASLSLASCSSSVNTGSVGGFLSSLTDDKSNEKTQTTASVNGNSEEVVQNSNNIQNSNNKATRTASLEQNTTKKSVGSASRKVIGGIADSKIGKSLNPEDLNAAAEAEFQALETGKTGVASPWRNPTNGRYGSVVASRPFKQQNIFCRQFTHTVYIDGKPKILRGIACRDKKGRWQNIG